MNNDNSTATQRSDQVQAPVAPINVSGIPDNLKSLRQWVVWRYEKRDDKQTKVPYQPNGDRAKSNNPATWVDFQTCLDALRNFDGIGIMFYDGLMGVDLDHHIDEHGRMSDFARKTVADLNTYWEVSPSGSGLHGLCYGTLPEGGRKNSKLGVEMYCTGRFFTVTGKHLPGTPVNVNRLNGELSRYHAEVFGVKSPETPMSTVGTKPVKLDDQQVIERAKNARNGDDFAALWRGDLSRHNKDHSAADLSLCGLLAFWTGRDAQRIDLLFRQSGLMRPKWDEKHFEDGRTYGAATVEKAIASCKEVYTPRLSATSDDPPIPDTPTDSPLPNIRAGGRQLRDVTEDALAAIQAANQTPKIFVRSGNVVRLRSDEHDRPLIDEVRLPAMRGLLARVANFIDIDRQGAARHVHPPKTVAEDILSLPAVPFPPLVGVTESPIVRADGTLLLTPGYDRATRLIYAPQAALNLPPVPESPTPAEIIQARNTLLEPFRDFPFVDQASLAHGLSIVITSVMRAAIRGPVPAIIINGTTPGTGKGLLTKVVYRISTGRDAEFTTAPDTDEEFRKRITARVRDGSLINILDNVDRTLYSASLAALLTADTWSDRILGTSDKIDVPNRFIWIITGNNVQLGGDIPRRAIWCNLDAQMPHPEDRDDFRIPDLMQWVTNHRGDLLRAVLILARGWYAAGCPAPTARPIGSFESWCRVVGGVLQFAGIPGFLVNREDMNQKSNQDETEWFAFLASWYGSHQAEQLTVAEMVKALKADESLAEALPATLTDDFASLVADEREGKSKRKSGSFSKKLGNALARFENRYFGYQSDAYHIERGEKDSHNKVQKWKVLRGLRGLRGLFPMDRMSENLGESTAPTSADQNHSQTLTNVNPANPANPASAEVGTVEGFEYETF